MWTHINCNRSELKRKVTTGDNIVISKEDSHALSSDLISPPQYMCRYNTVTKQASEAFPLVMKPKIASGVHMCPHLE